MTETEKLLGELVALPSVNPAFLPPGHRDAGEARVADFLGATAANAGLDVDFQKVALGRSNVIARLAPSGVTPNAAFCSPRIWILSARGTVFSTRDQRPASRSRRLRYQRFDYGDVDGFDGFVSKWQTSGGD